MRFAFLAVALVLAACAPFVVVPGRELTGTLASGTVTDWSFTDAAGTVQLETRPDRPYSINIWGVSSGTAFYVASRSGGDARWVGHIAEDSRVRLRVGETLYERKAVRVEDSAELASVMALYEKKYGPGTPASRLPEGWGIALSPFDPDDWEGAWVFRLDAR